MVPVTAGQKVGMALAYFDTNHKPMLTPVTPDSPPAWSDAPSAPGIATLTPSADGTTAELQTNAGDATSVDNVSVSVVVGGQTFSATVEIDIAPTPQVLGSVEITTTVSS